MIITLEPQEIMFVSERALARRAVKLRARARNFRSDPIRDDVAIMKLGLAANCAVGKYLGVAPDYIDYRGSGKDYDMVFQDRTIKTKYTNYTDLSLTSPDKVTADVIVLCKGKLPDIDLVGWTDYNLFVENSKVKNWGYGDRYVLDPAKLYNIEYLKYGLPEKKKEQYQVTLGEFVR